MIRPLTQPCSETGVNLVIFFKKLMQLYLFCWFHYSLTFCIKEVIKGNLFCILNIKKVLAYEAATAWDRGNPSRYFSKHYSNCIFFLLLFNFLNQIGYQRKHHSELNYKGVSLWGSYGLEQGNTFQNYKIINQIVFVPYTDLLFYLIYERGYQS